MRKAVTAITTSVISLLLMSAACGDAFAQGSDTLCIYPPKQHLSRLSRALNLTNAQKAKIKRVVEKADTQVRQAVKSRDKQIRSLLNEDQRELFDAVKDELDRQQRAEYDRPRIRPIEDPWGEEQDPRMRGGQGPMRGGQRGPMGPGGMMPGGRQGGPGGGRGGRGQRRPSLEELCGDGVCLPPERRMGSCPADCD